MFFTFGACRTCRISSDYLTELDYSIKVIEEASNKENEAPEGLGRQSDLQDTSSEEGELREPTTELSDEEMEKQRLEGERLRHRWKEVKALRELEREVFRWEQLQRWMEQYGVSSVNEQKREAGGLFSTSGFTCPLHMAVRANDAHAIDMLLSAGADKEGLDSSRRSPMALALKLDRNGSHQGAIDALSLP